MAIPGKSPVPWTKPRAEKLVRAAKLVGGTTTVLARVPIGLSVKMPIGLSVKKGTPHPDISSVEAKPAAPGLSRSGAIKWRSPSDVKTIGS
jgi:hypothetical protein